jgi:hypothetical protein
MKLLSKELLRLLDISIMGSLPNEKLQYPKKSIFRCPQGMTIN